MSHFPQSLGQLDTALTKTSGGAAVGGQQFDYGYDAGWNMTSRATGSGSATYTVNDRNQATTVAGFTQSYNALGNRVFEDTGAITRLDYTYDAENQLTSVATDTYGTPDAGRWKMEFVYDGRGRMRIRRDFVWSAGVWSLSSEQRYVYDGMRLLQQRSSANVPQVSYTRGLDLSGSLDGAGGIGGLLARSTHATTSPHAVNSSAYYHADGNGNITYLLRSDAAANASYRYDPFGRTLSSSGTLAAANVLRFSSKPILLSSYGTWGDYYYGYRFYDPESQRWLNRDPIGEQNGLVIDLNLYGYVRNSPLGLIDAYGLASGGGVAAPPGKYYEDSAIITGGKLLNKKFNQDAVERAKKECGFGNNQCADYCCVITATVEPYLAGDQIIPRITSASGTLYKRPCKDVGDDFLVPTPPPGQGNYIIKIGI